MIRPHLLFIPLFAAGCATLSEKECRSADWHQIGFNDGREGFVRARVEDHSEACSKTGVSVDRDRYFAGREAGLRQYCTPEGGFRAGSEGKSYSEVCPPALAPAFLSRYEAGKRIYDLRRRIDSLESERRDKERKLDKASSDDERKRLRDELRNIDRDLRRERDALRWQEEFARR